MKLYEHQIKIINEAPDKYGLFLGCGCGKTIIAIKLAEKKKCDALVICPKSLVENWQREIKKFGKGNIKFGIYSKENFKKYIKEIPKYSTMIWDEAHYASGYKSQIHKATLAYIKRWDVEHIYLLTGTPYMANCWSVYALGIILGKNWTWYAWKKAFFNEIRLGKKPPPGQRDRRVRIVKQKEGIETRIANIVNKIGVTAKLEDLFDVPDQVYLHEYFDLTREQKKAMENVVEPYPIADFTKYHQICGGTLKGNEYEESQFFKSEKLSRLLDLCKENKKVAIICRYNCEIDMIAEKIRENVYVINGSVSDKQSVIDEINSKEDAIVLISSGCSEGYNLWSVPLMIFYSLDFSWKNYWQILYRIQRANHIKKNVYIVMITKNSIDEAVYACISKKRDFHAEIFKEEL